MPKENIYNVPNLLSFYRIAVFPFILYMVWSGNEKLFSIFLCVSLITDILDGLIARTFKLQTRFGARLDSLADIGTYILAICGVIKFNWSNLRHSPPLLWIFMGAYLLPLIV